MNPLISDPQTATSIYETLEVMAFSCLDQVSGPQIANQDGQHFSSEVIISGDVQGQVLIAASAEFTDSLVDAILDTTHDEDPTAREACLNELANILCGVFVGAATHAHHRYAFTEPRFSHFSGDHWNKLAHDRQSLCFDGLDGSLIAYANFTDLGPASPT